MGSLAIAAINPVRRGLLLLGILIGLGGLLIAFSLLSYTGLIVPIFVIAIFLGMSTAAFLPIANSTLVQAAPDNMRGRILGLLSLDRGMTTLGGMAAGVIAALWGVQITQILFGICCIFTAIIIFFMISDLKKI